MKEETTQVNVIVPIMDLWKSMTMMRHILPKVLPDIIEKVELLEGDGGQGSIILVNFCPHIQKVRYQKEKIVELDESLYQITVELLEGGNLDYEFTSYMSRLKLTAVEAETLIDVKVMYETKVEDNAHVPGETLKPSLHYIKCLEKYLLNGMQ